MQQISQTLSISNSKMTKEKILQVLNETGFPFEIEVRKKLRKLGINTTPTRYFVETDKGFTSRDLDVFGIIHEDSVKMDRGHCKLKFQVLGEVKKYIDYNICYFRLDGENPENILIKLPNFTSLERPFLEIAESGLTLTKLKEKITNLNVSKSICVVEKNKNFNPKKPNSDEFKENGNKPIFDNANELIRACEFFHNKHIKNYNDPVYHVINWLVPVIFTKAKIFEVSIEHEEAKELKEKNHLLYLVACLDLDKVPITAREYFYLPVFIVNEDGINDILSNLLNWFKQIHAKLANFAQTNPEIIKQEIQKYQDKYHKKYEPTIS